MERERSRSASNFCNRDDENRLSDPFFVDRPGDIIDHTDQVGAWPRERSRLRNPGLTSEPVLRRIHTPPPARTTSRPGSQSPHPDRNLRRSGSPLLWWEGHRPPEEAER